MKTTVDIPEQVLQEAMAHAKSSTKRDAVIAALEDFNRRHRQAAMVKYLGTFEDFITPQELTSSRSERSKRHDKQRRGK